MLAEHRIGAVIVSRDGAIVDGILSERDIVRALGTLGVALLDLQVQELMTAEVIGCQPDDTAISVLETMTDGRFRHMPVIDEDRDGRGDLDRRRGQGADRRDPVARTPR